MNANNFIKCIILAFIIIFACSVFPSIVSAESNNHSTNNDYEFIQDIIKTENGLRELKQNLKDLKDFNNERNNHDIPIVHYNEKTGAYTNINQTINFKTDKFKGEHNNWSLVGADGKIKCKFAKGYLDYDDSGFLNYIISEKPCKSCPHAKTLPKQSDMYQDMIIHDFPEEEYNLPPNKIIYDFPEEKYILLDEPLFLSNSSCEA